MPLYSYTALDQAGNASPGSLEARDEHELARALGAQRLLLLRADSKKARLSMFSQFMDVSNGFFGVSTEEILMLIRNMKVMITAGVPLPKALDILSLQAKGQSMRKTLVAMREKIMQGFSLSQAMALYPAVFSELFVHMVQVGEESGTLEEALSQLATQTERSYELSSKIKSAMMYPAVIITAMIAIGIIMIIYVVPKLAESFKDLGVTLPASTRFVIGLADFLIHRWYVVILGALGVFAGIFFARRTEEGKRFIDTILLRIPFVSEIIVKTNAAFTVRILGSLIAAGVPIVRALEITARVLNNVHFRSVLMQGAEDVKKGAKLSQVFRQYGHVYPFVVTQMVEVGEETGKTAEIFATLANFYEDEVGAMTKNLAAVIEPVLMLIIGAVVGFFAISMITPMYSMLRTVQ